jgi:hypothetical protein
MRDAGTRNEETREFREQQYQSVRVLGIHGDRAMTDTVLVDVRRVRVGKIQSTPNKTLTHERRLRDVTLEDIEKSGRSVPVSLAASLLQHPPATLRR